MKFVLGKKIGMTTLYDKDKGALNVTLVECEPNSVSQIRTKEKDGYAAIQSFVKKTKKVSVKREVRLSEDISDLKVGDSLGVSQFSVGDIVCVSGITKAKGFQGVVKRHGFSGAPKTHGHKHDLRAPGSIGAQQPQHVIKGKRMAGRMGGERSTTKNLKVVFVDSENNILAVKGAVPGVNGRIVEIKGV